MVWTCLLCTIFGEIHNYYYYLLFLDMEYIFTVTTICLQMAVFLGPLSVCVAPSQADSDNIEIKPFVS